MSNTSFTKSLIATAVIGAIALTGCGGGSDSSTSTDTPSATASGVAAKGIIKFATITAYELNATGGTVRTVGSGETDANGKYSLTIGSGYTGGPLKLVLSAKSDGSTKMVCDISGGCGAGVGYGQDFTLSPTFTLAAFHQAASSGAIVRVQITPFSNMAAARIQAQIAGGATLDNALVANAISEVSQIAGINIAEVEPVDITNAEAVAAARDDALQYAAFNAGIGNVAFGNANGFEAGIAAVAASFADGQFDSSDAVSIASIVAAVSAVASATPALSTATLTATLASIAANTAVDGTYNPEPALAATQAAVAQAKGLVSQIRTWGTELAALQTPAEAFSLDIDTASAVINSNSGALAGVFGSVISGALNTVLAEAASSSGLLARPYTYPVTRWTATGPVSTTGNVTVVDNGGFLKLTISATNSGVTTSATINTNIPSTVLGNPAPLNVAQLTIAATGSATMSTPSVASISFSNTALSIALKAGAASATATEADIASIGFNGGLTMEANGVTFTGTGKFSIVSNNVVNANSPVSLEELALSGTFTGSKGSATASASVKLNNAANFDVFGLLNHEPVLWIYKQLPPGDALGIAAAYAAANGGDTLQHGYYGSYNNQTCGEGLSTPSACVSGDVYGLRAAALSAISTNYTNPTPIGVQNVYSRYDVNYGTYYNAMLTFGDFESATNFAQATVTVSAGVALAGYPAAKLTVTANRTAFTTTSPVAGNVVAILSYNGQSMTIEADNTVAAGTLAITNPDGVKLVISSSNGIKGDVKVNGEPVGTIESSSGLALIRYADGTFESLK